MPPNAVVSVGGLAVKNDDIPPIEVPPDELASAERSHEQRWSSKEARFGYSPSASPHLRLSHADSTRKRLEDDGGGLNATVGVVSRPVRRPTSPIRWTRDRTLQGPSGRLEASRSDNNARRGGGRSREKSGGRAGFASFACRCATAPGISAREREAASTSKAPPTCARQDRRSPLGRPRPKGNSRRCLDGRRRRPNLSVPAADRTLTGHVRG